jgi:hypothetical protein
MITAKWIGAIALVIGITILTIDRYGRTVCARLRAQWMP